MGLNIDENKATTFQSRLVAPSSFIAGNATVIGHVEVGEHSSVWFGTVIRGDSDRIIIGEDSNIQDLSVIHTDTSIECQIGNRVTIGHGAIVHGACVADEVLIGMRSVILNRVSIGSGSIIAPGAIVTEGTVVPSGSIVMGIPGQVVRQANDNDRTRIDSAWRHYRELAQLHRRRSHR